jgi:hypothetical protein
VNMRATFLRPASPARRSEPRPVNAEVAACLALIAALTHLVAIPDHIATWWAAAVFFAVVTIGQGVLAAALLMRSLGPRVLVAALVSQVAVIGIYVVDRTAGLPWGPPITAHGTPAGPGVPIIPGAVDPVGMLDLIALISEVALVIVLVVMLPDRARRVATYGLMLAGIALWMLAGFGVLA